MSSRRVLHDYNDIGLNRKRTARVEIFEKCLRATLSELGFQKWSRGCGRNGARECRFRPLSAAGRIRRNTPPDSGWPEHPDTDYHLPQVWDDRACGGTACQRTSLDPGFGPVRNRVEGSNPRPGERMGSIPRATPAGRRRKSLGRGPAKLLALKIAAGASRPKTCGSEFCVAACILITHVLHSDVSRVATKYSRPSKGGNRTRGWH